MALPTTNLTLHLDASDSGHVFEDDAHTDPCEDGDNINCWTDDDGKDLAMFYWTTATPAQGADWVSTPMILPAADFNGTSEMMGLFEGTRTTAIALDDIMDASAKTMILSLRVKSASLNNAASYNNHFILGGGIDRYFGLYARTSGGLYYLQLFNWDGNEDVVEKQISLNTTYVVTLRHDGTNLYIGLDGAAESSVASGATTNMAANLKMGETDRATQYGDFLIGELAVWTAALTSTNLTDANSYFTSKWLPATDNAPYIPPRFQQAIQRGAFF